MGIEWFNEKPKEGIVTVSNSHITLNKPATTFFETAYAVMLGFDKDEKQFIIKPLDKAQALRNDVATTKKYKITVRSSYSRVTNKAFIEELSFISNLNFELETYKFVANWDNKNKILVVDMKEVIK